MLRINKPPEQQGKKNHKINIWKMRLPQIGVYFFSSLIYVD